LPKKSEENKNKERRRGRDGEMRKEREGDGKLDVGDRRAREAVGQRNEEWGGGEGGLSRDEDEAGVACAKEERGQQGSGGGMKMAGE